MSAYLENLKSFMMPQVKVRLKVFYFLSLIKKVYTDIC